MEFLIIAAAAYFIIGFILKKRGKRGMKIQNEMETLAFSRLVKIYEEVCILAKHSKEEYDASKDLITMTKEHCYTVAFSFIKQLIEEELKEIWEEYND